MLLRSNNAEAVTGRGDEALKPTLSPVVGAQVVLSNPYYLWLTSAVALDAFWANTLFRLVDKYRKGLCHTCLLRYHPPVSH